MAKTKQKEIVKVGKNGSKEFKARFHHVGKVSPVRKKEQNGDNWFDVPYFEVKPTKSGKPRRVTQLQLETAMSNNLKFEVAGMEQDFAYPYSMKERNSFKITWEDRLDKTKYPNESYHIINGTDWDRAGEVGELLQNAEGDIWAEVRGIYEFSTLENDNGEERTFVKRNIEQFNIIENGAEINLGRNNTITYVTDFESPDFIEVNTYTMQIGIKSTYQEDEGKDTKVNAVFLQSSKVRSEPYDVELIVSYKEPKEGTIALADAFASLNHLDFIEAIGQDHNRATFTYVDIEETLSDEDPFNEVASDEKVVRQERVVSGDKKGFEITGYTAGTIARGFLTEEEIAKSTNPFNTQNSSNKDPFDPFFDEGKPIDISSDDLPF
ncbi:hypothetical protein [Paenibacillus sp. NAIST15-1]|uniref:hypothetical protein n=1 Tax=Paenibacillus sp. NAIST15-1 TaxID=1605994 RepID=UPI00086AEE3D|nr:hypothetical protein [Paenibacillus sp. NAIST15-1]GAV11382.1 single-stranded DNA-binding protein [Paenibacillus sp. NAIST15-1]